MQLWTTLLLLLYINKSTTMMDDLYPSRKEMRFTGFDYRAKGCYFITVVAHNHVCLFGHVEDGKMVLNDPGKMIDHLYHTVEDRFPQVVCMDSVVMPNHFHCVLYLDVDNSDSIYKVMDCFKSMTTNEYIKGVKEKGWKHFDGHLWQRNYWDDIIWNDRQLKFVQNYIALNPSRWNKDNINPQHDEDVDHILQQFKKLG